MKISIIGTGYVGLITGVGFASRGHDVTCVDIDQKKVDMINRGEPPIYEKGLKEFLGQLAGKKLRATTDLEKAVRDTDVTFISVGTPSRKDGSIDLCYIEQAARGIGNVLKDKSLFHTVVVKSTVVPGTTENTVQKAIERESGRKQPSNFGLCMNPEFLREGMAIDDFLNPDRIVIGESDKRSGDVVAELYTDFHAPFLRTKIKVAEMIKYASNAMLATRISFSNEIGNLCKKIGIDVYDVMKGVGMDSRICPKFLQAGAGYGGSCFPKDVSAIVSQCQSFGYQPPVLKAVMQTNDAQKTRMVAQLEEKLGSLSGKKVAVLGLAFKADSDDIREAPALEMVKALLAKGAKVAAYDPEAMENTRKEIPSATYAKSTAEALKGSDACLVVTDWAEFKALTDADFSAMKGNVIIEGRKILDKAKVAKFEGICW
jgi:UDPglucose 6-dehydrogenase